MDKSIFETLENIMNRKIALLPQNLRPAFADIKNTDSRGLMIVGPRGTGKTTYILNRIKGSNILYFSADNPIIAGESLWDIGLKAFNEGYEGIAVDEVHHSKNWSGSLKALYDAYPDKHLLASDSSSILLKSGLADLSRRFVQIKMNLLSFREFIFLKTGTLLPKIKPFHSENEKITKIFKTVNIMKLFKEYLKTGTRPIFLEGDYHERLLNIIEKTIYSDIPFFVPSIVDNNFRLLNAVIGYLAHSKIPTLSVRSLCSKWEIGALKLYKLLSIMESVGLIRIIRHEKDFKANSIGEKIFLYDPSMYSALDGDIGNSREAFAAAMLSENGFKVSASKDERECDFIIGKVKIEIGGRGKDAKKADFVFRDDLDIPNKNCIPLWTLGFGY